MGLNIFQQEARDIRNYLDRNGYQSRQGPDHVVVLDPVYQSVSGDGNQKQHGFVEVSVRNWPQAIAFVEARA